MSGLSPGRGVWFSEQQSDGSSKVVPAIVLWVAETRPVVVVARGTSQFNDRFCSGEGALEIAPSDPCGRRLQLSLLTRFRANDVKVIATESIIQTCPRLTRDVWKQILEVTREAIERERAALAASTQ
jgi:hypothetical protein